MVGIGLPGLKMTTAQKPLSKLLWYVGQDRQLMLRILRRCMNQPSVCKAAAKQVGRGDSLSLATSPQPAEVYSSQASCCKPGLGAFQEGCSFDA